MSLSIKLTKKYDFVEPYINVTDYFLVGIKGNQTDRIFWGIVNSEGEEVISCKHEKDITFFEIFEETNFNTIRGYKAAMLNEEGQKLYGVYDEKGNIVIECKYDNICPESGMGFKIAEKDRKTDNLLWGCTNSKGDTIIEPKYAEINPCGLNSYYIAEKDGNNKLSWGVVDKKGDTIINCEYNKIEYNYFSELYEVDKLDTVKNDYLKGLLDEKGNEVVPCIYNTLISTKLPEIYKAEVKDIKGKGHWQILNKEGEAITECIYSQIKDRYDVSDSHNNLDYDTIFKVAVEDDKTGKEKWGLIDAENGELLVSPEYDGMKTNRNGKVIIFSRVNENGSKETLIWGEGEELSMLSSKEREQLLGPEISRRMLASINRNRNLL